MSKDKKVYHPELPPHISKFEDCVIEKVHHRPKDEDIIDRDYCELIYAKKEPRLGKADKTDTLATCHYYIYIPVEGGYERICIPYEC